MHMQRFMPGVYDFAYTYDNRVAEAPLVCEVVAEHPDGLAVNGVGELEGGERLEVMLTLGRTGMNGTWLIWGLGCAVLEYGSVQLSQIPDDPGAWSGKWCSEDSDKRGSCTIALPY
jgi:hypothetical protein